MKSRRPTLNVPTVSVPVFSTWNINLKYSSFSHGLLPAGLFVHPVFLTQPAPDSPKPVACEIYLTSLPIDKSGFAIIIVA